MERGFQKLTLSNGPKFGLFKTACGLIGPEDAMHWYKSHQQLFTHPRFIEEMIYHTTGAVRRVMSNHNIPSNAIWAHPHPDRTNFGVYIVRQGEGIIYQGRSTGEVMRFLGMKVSL